MANKRNFLITKKALSEYLQISRPTLDARLDRSSVDLSGYFSVLSWIQFESMGITTATKRFNEYIWNTRGERCEICGSHQNLQIAHDKPKSLVPEGALLAQNVKILCVDCHNKLENHPRVGNGKPTKITNHYARNKTVNQLRKSMHVL